MTRIAALRSLLSAMLVSPQSVDGISPPPVPNDAFATSDYPYLTIRQVMAKELQSLEGRSNYVDSIMQVDAWHRDYEVAGAMRENLKGTLMVYSGTAGDLYIDGINHIMDADIYDSDRKLHNCLARYAIVWVTP